MTFTCVVDPKCRVCGVALTVKLHNDGNYIAQIKVNGKDIHLGYRSSAQAAYEELYVPAALKYHGDFARLA